MRHLAAIAFVTAASFIFSATAAADTLAWLDLGGPSCQRWSGLQSQNADRAVLAVPGTASFSYPAGTRGFYKRGFRMENDSTADWKPFYGVRFAVRLDDSREVELTVSVLCAVPNGADATLATRVRICGEGLHEVTLPWSAFQYPQAGQSFLRFARGLSVGADFTDNKPGQIALRNVRVIKAPVVALETAVRGKSAGRDAEAAYPVLVTNCTDQPESVSLHFVRYGWEVMNATVTPEALQLAPGESKSVTVDVHVSPRVPPGGHENQVLQAIANGDATHPEDLTLTTVCELPHPYILHTPSQWNEVKENIARYAWAREAFDKYENIADRWNVPEIAKPPRNDPGDTYGPFLFATQNENSLLACAYSWVLAGNKSNAEKVATFLRRLSDPKTGYPATLRGCNQSLVQEGHFFQHIAMAYDMILDAGILSDADRAQIENTFRLFMTTIELQSESGSINNWNLAEACGAFYCALAMQDLAAADRFFAGPSGIREQLGKGTMDDGWWYECSISYNMWCASEFTQAALAYQPFGYNFKDERVPASYSRDVLLYSRLNGGAGVESLDPGMKGKPFGMDPTVYGPSRRPYRTITDLWNSLLPFIDYRGVMFGVNDSTEAQIGGYRTEVSGKPFEIAYYAFHDPRYASMIKLGGGPRDLLYGVPDLPANTPEECRNSAFADNVGLVMLRSQTPNRPVSEQIQAVLHYGTHGWAHGHYDRTDLLSLMRYGRSFWNPESVFYVYEPFMYKFYTQTSLNHNMVVVDQKMQEATPGERLLFHTGSAMQATVVQTVARWSNPPYGGMVYDYVPVKTFEEKTWREGRSVPIPKNPPAYGTLTDFTEHILQRRLMVVTDDYVLLADYDKGAKPHTFDNLLSIKGFEGLDAPAKKFLRHDAQWNSDPVGSAQFVTDCDWYAVHAPAVAQFTEHFGPGADNEGSRSVGNTDGVLKLAVHSLWPPDQQIMVATAPEMHNVAKQLYYTVHGDGRTLADGKFGAWILGQGDIDVPVEGVRQLTLETRTKLARRATLFWANARIVTREGKEIPLSQLPISSDNVLPSKGHDLDYDGGPVKIAGNEYKNNIAAEPKDEKQPGIVTVDLSGTDAVRFKAVIGSDYPPGPEAQRRKTYAIRAAVGSSATFLTLIEPYERDPMVASASASDANTVHVELADGRVQDITFDKLEGDGQDIRIMLRESKDGKVVRTEESTTDDLHRE